MARVVAALIVRDSVSTLGACLESVKPFVDDIVVLDTGSSDGTMALAKTYTEDVHRSRNVQYAQYFHFADARNECLTHCRDRDWILSIDADETLHGDTQRFRRVLEKGGERMYSVTVDTATSNRFVHADRKRSLGSRLYLNDGETKWDFRVHEMLTPGTPKFAIADKLLWIRHGAKGAAVTASLNRNRGLLQMQLEEERERGAPNRLVKTLVDMGQTYNDLRLYPEAIGAYEASLAMIGDKGAEEFRSFICYQLALGYWHMNLLDRALIRCVDSIDLQPSRISAAMLGACCCMDLESWQEAQAWLEHAGKIVTPVRSFSWEGQKEQEREWVKEKNALCKENMNGRAEPAAAISG